MKIKYLIFITLLISAGCASTNGTNPKVEFIPDEVNNELEIYIDDKLFTNFFYPDNMEKPVLYPIYTSSGKDITRGYPYNPKPFERYDHPHHVGLWLNFGDVNGLDFWNNSFAVNPENKHKYGSIRFREIISQDPGSGVLVAGSDWVDNDNNILLNEETTFVFNENDGVRSIKRTSTLTAVQDVRFQGNEEGLLGLRVDRAFEEPADSPQRLLDGQGNMKDERILDNEGVNGAYRNADGDRGSAVWGERSPWVALSAEKEEEVITIAIFDHHANPYYPAWSHARGYGLFAVNNLGGRDMHNDAEEVEINLSPGESISFTHLIIIGEDMTDDELNQIHNQFNNH
ncbi:MAG: PmoA family protein [Cyclobacteriaceae bacterium]